MKKIVFMGTSEYAKTILEALFLENFEILALVTQEDKPVGRKQILTPPATKKWILENYPNVPIFQPKSLRNDEIFNKIADLSPDFIVVAAYGKILPKNFIDLVPCINLHASILPKFRGASPIQSAILEGIKTSGVTAIRMTENLDDGDILGISECEIYGIKSQDVFKLMAKIAANLCVKTLKNFDFIKPIPQNHDLHTKCIKIKKSDGLINFNLKCQDVMQKFLAFHDWPGIFLENGLKFCEIFIFSNQKNGNLGEVSEIKKDFFAINFSDGQIGIKKICEPGKKELLAKDFINGKRLKIGDKL